MLGLKFPCGAELDKMAQASGREFKIKPSMKGLDCSLSGVENKARLMLQQKENHNDIAKFVISGNSMLQNKLGKKYGAYFAKPEYSCDNAAGVAVYAYLKSL